MEKKKKTGPDECCRAERQIGYEVRTLNQVIGRLVNSYQSKVDEKAGINRMQGWIIGYLYRHSEEAVFQKDLEAEFQMARSTASGILQAMEKKGLITREPMEFQMEIMENFDRIQKVLKSDIPQEKLECFLEVLDMIRENAQRECCLRDEN